MTKLISQNFFCLRRPVKELNIVLNLFEIEALDPQNLKSYLLTLFHQDNLREAIGLASPDIIAAVEKWEVNGLSKKKEKRLLKGLFKYIARLSGRSTPFGLFAGNSLGIVTEQSSRFQVKADDFSVKSRLDMACVIPLIKAISDDECIYTQLRFYPNNSIYKTQKKYRFYRWDVQHHQGNYQLINLPESEFLDKVLKDAKNGVLYPALLKYFISDLQDEELAITCLRKLIADQLFIHELHPKVTGGIFFQDTLVKLITLNGTEKIVADMYAIQAVLNANSAEVDKKLSDILSAYFPLKSKRLIQKDVSFIADEKPQLNRTVLENIKDDVNHIIQLGSIKGNKSLSDFKLQFSQRYGDQMVSVLEALDPVYGIKYTGSHQHNLEEWAPALKNVSIPDLMKKPDVRLERKYKFLSTMLQDVFLNKRSVVKLSKEDLNQISSPNPPRLPDTVFLMGSLIAEKESTLDAGDFKFAMHHLAGPSGANLMTRFCHGDESLEKAVKDLLAIEEESNPNAIIAEVVHLPEPRMGNVVMRPILRSFEIPLITRAGVAADNEIGLDDLLITLKNNRLVLYSKRFNKEVIPRLTTAHNYSTGMQIYKLFGDLQFQDYAYFHSWDWGPFETEKFLPRITYNKLILQRARWMITSAEYHSWLAFNKSSESQEFIKLKISSFEINNLVLLKEFDNELLLDLRSDICLQILVDQLLIKDVFLYEFLLNKEACLVQDQDRKFVHELIIPFGVKKTESIEHFLLKETECVDYISNFPLGSEWLYVKIYATYQILDEIIREVLMPLAASLIAEGLIDQWFFIRFKDPDHHLRVRFHNKEDLSFWTVILDKLNRLLRSYSSSGLFVKLETDTYQQEIWRYGLATIGLAERLFYVDSVAVSGLLSTLHVQGTEEERLFLALASIDSLMEDFDYTLVEKHQLTETLFGYFYLEHNGENSSRDLISSLDTKYRSSKSKIANFIDVSAVSDGFKPYKKHLNIRSIENSEISIQISNVLKRNNNCEFRYTLMSAFIHMSLNRLFMVNQRQHELIVYHHLSKYYDSVLARMDSY